MQVIVCGCMGCLKWEPHLTARCATRTVNISLNTNFECSLFLLTILPYSHSAVSRTGNFLEHSWRNSGRPAGCNCSCTYVRVSVDCSLNAYVYRHSHIGTRAVASCRPTAISPGMFEEKLPFWFGRLRCATGSGTRGTRDLSASEIQDSPCRK